MAFIDFTVPVDALVPLVLAAGAVWLAIWVYWYGRQSRVAGTFFLLSLAISFQLYCLYRFHGAVTAEEALWWTKRSFLVVPFVPALFYQFVVQLTGQYSIKQYRVYICWLFGVVVAGLAFNTDGLLEGMRQYSWGYYPDWDWLMGAFIGGFLVIAANAFAEIYRVYTHIHSSLERERLRAMALAASFGLLWTVDMLPELGLPVYPVGYVGLVGFVSLSGRAIQQYRFVDITAEFAANEIVDTASDYILMLDTDEKVRFANLAAREMLLAGGALDQADVLSQLIGDAKLAQFRHYLQEKVHDVEMTVHCRKGNEIPVRVSTAALRDSGGIRVGTVVIARDITEWKKVERLVSRSVARNQAIIRAIPDRLVRLSPEGIIRWVDSKDGHQTPYRHGESLREIFGRDVGMRFERARRTVVEDGGVQRFAYSRVSDDGTEHHYEVRMVGVGYGDLLLIERDITVQRKLQQEVLRVSGREQRRIGRDLHDGLCSRLAGTSMVVQGLVHLIEDGETVSADQLRDVADLIQEGVKSARALAHGLNPINLNGEGLAVALEKLAAIFSRKQDVFCVAKTAGALFDIKEDMAVQLYRIAQEAVANAITHGDAKHVTISLCVTDRQVTLIISDDGRGLDSASSANDGMGLHIMQYRADMIGGTFSIQNASGGGVQVRCVVPWDPAFG